MPVFHQTCLSLLNSNLTAFFSRHLSLPGAEQRRQQDTAGKKTAFVVIWSDFLLTLSSVFQCIFMVCSRILSLLLSLGQRSPKFNGQV